MLHDIKKWAVFLLTPFLACSSYDYHAGKFYQGIHHEISAAQFYTKFIERAPHDFRAAEINVRLGDIDSHIFHRCSEARRHYETAAREFQDQKEWAQKAQIGLLSCPDFFPIQPGYLWVYGDSSSKGKNMRLTWKSHSSGNAGENKITSILYAGKKQIKKKETLYQKKDWAIFSEEKKRDIPLLKYPFQSGHSWITQNAASERHFLIESTSATVKTAAGVFNGCLKVKESYGRFPRSWKYTYYAPFIGWVKTTIAGPGFESPNTELIRYQAPTKN